MDLFLRAIRGTSRVIKKKKKKKHTKWTKMWLINTMEHYSAIKKNKIMPFAATWIQLEILILSEVSQKKTNTIGYHLYVESKMWHK